MCNSRFSDLTIGQLNCNGIKDKLEDLDFLSLITVYDVCILLETHAQKCINISGYLSYSLPAIKLPGVKSGRYSGGITILYKETLKLSIKPYKRFDNYAIWVKLDKKILNLDKHLFIGGVYIPPSESQYALKTPFDDLEQDFLELSDGHIFCGGDFNARVSNLKDYIEHYDSDCFTEFQDDHFLPTDRKNMDDVVNVYGRKFLKFCKSTNSLILNGRSSGDFNGMYTFHGASGSSTVDYQIISPTLMPFIKYFNVCSPSWFSDHSFLRCRISLPLKYDSFNSIPKVKLSPVQTSYKWDENSEETVLTTFKSDYIANKISELHKSTSIASNVNVNDLSIELCSIYKNVMKLSLKVKKKKSVNLKKSSSSLSRSIKYDIYKVGKLLQLFPSDPFLRGKFFVLKKRLKSVLKQSLLSQKQKIMSNLNLLESKDPNAFWKLVKSLRNAKNESGFNLDPDLIHNYFKELNEGIKNPFLDSTFRSDIEAKLTRMKGSTYIDILDDEITMDELKKVIMSLKNNKSVGLDSISNELLKCSFNFMSDLLLTLYNNVLESSIYVNSWLDDFIAPILKSGGIANDPTSYRGISISSCVGKVFTIIMKNRFIRFLELNNLISNCQIGFTSGKRTTDHIFVLKTIMDLAKSKKKPLYMCFVDLKSAFDTVWRKGLLYKMIKMGFSEKIISLLQNIFSKTSTCVRTSEGYTEKFLSTVGTRQGCNLSPILFNIFINDIPTILNEIDAKQPFILDEKISCLMYADDLILFSFSHEGLQMLLDRLQIFCNKWQLTINTVKTKIMIAHSRKCLHSWYIYGKRIDIVKQFCYLGVVIDSCGKFIKGIERLYIKANRAYHSIKSNISFYNGGNVNTLCKLFDSMVKPILLYGSELWGVFNWRLSTADCIEKTLFCTKSSFEKLHHRFCKQTLGLSKRASGSMALSELGRYGLYFNITNSAYKFYQHLLNSNVNSLSYKSLCVNVDMQNKGIQSYSSRIEGLLEYLCCPELNNTMSNDSIKRNANALSINFSKAFEFKFFNKLERDNKYAFFDQLKHSYNRERYLQFVYNSSLRRTLSKIRCCDNSLPVNYFRYKNVNGSDFNCLLCNKYKGNEAHALLECPITLELRSCFFKDIDSIFPHLNVLSQKQKLHYLLLCIEPDPTIKFAIFCNKLLTLYNEKAKDYERNKCIFKEKACTTVSTRSGRVVTKINDSEYIFYS